MSPDFERFFPPQNPPSGYFYSRESQVAMSLFQELVSDEFAGIPVAFPMLAAMHQQLLDGWAQEERFLSVRSCFRQAIKQVIFPFLWGSRSKRIKTLEYVPKSGVLVRIEAADMQKQWGLISNSLQQLRDMPIWLLCGNEVVPSHCATSGFPAVPNSIFLNGTMAEFVSAYIPKIARWNRITRKVLTAAGLPPRASFRFSAVAAEVLMYGVQMRSLLRQTRPKMIVVDCDHHPISTWLVFLAKTMGIPTVTLQHGTLADPLFFFPLWADRAFLWGKEHVEMFEDFGAPRESLQIVGCPRMEPISEAFEHLAESKVRFKIPTKNRVILLATERGLDQDRIELVRTAVEGIKSCSDHTLLIKCHPAEAPEFYRRILGEEPNVRIVSDEEVNLSLALSLCDVVLAQWSGVACDALLFGKPVILLGGQQSLLSNQKILDKGACLMARNAGELNSLLINETYLRSRNPSLGKQADEYVRSFYSAYGSQSAHLTAAGLRQLWETVSPRAVVQEATC